jgi:hypothetical protein
MCRIPACPFHIPPVSGVVAITSTIPPVPEVGARFPPLFAVKLDDDRDIILFRKREEFEDAGLALVPGLIQVGEDRTDPQANTRGALRALKLLNLFKYLFVSFARYNIDNKVLLPCYGIAMSGQ